MALKLFNTLSRSVEEFVPLDPAGKAVRMYCCGPTVYDFGHIGNFRTFVFSDLVRRYLQFRGYEVTHVMNITDVEDKIIKRVGESGGTLRQFVSKYEDAFLEDLQTLNCLRPHHLPRATEHIAEMIGIIEALMKRGIAYQAADGSVYFSIEKYRACGCRYGQLVNLNFDQMRVGERVASDEYTKDSLADFALWKARVPEDGAVFWPSPWGEGRPGWHIECSAMSMKLLGPSFDLHLGGEDLAFPHHEDEIAQSEGAGWRPDGQRFVKCWLHGAHLLVEGKKMSKSLGNFFTLRDLLAKGFTGREIRAALLSAHYRETYNFTLKGLEDSRVALARLDECLAKVEEVARAASSLSPIGGEGRGEGAGRTPMNAGPPHPNPLPQGGEGTIGGEGRGEGAANAVAAPDQQLIDEFTAAMDDDLNVSKAWGTLFEWIRETNRLLAANQLSASAAAAGLGAWERLDSVFGLGRKRESEAPAEIVALLEQRQAARATKDFKRSDALRDELKAKGWIIEDTPKGPKLKRA